MTFSIRRFANFVLMLAFMAPAAVWGQGAPNPKLVEAAKR